MSALTVTDLANGTGARVYSDGPGGATAYRVQRATVTATAIGSYADVIGPISAETTTNPLAGTGYYMWRLVQDSNSDVLVSPFYQPVTSEGDSVHERCLTMLKDRYDALNLETPTGTELGVYIRQMNDHSNVTFPCIILAIAGLAEEQPGGSNMQDDWNYPTMVWIHEACKADADRHRAWHLSIRDRLMRVSIGPKYDMRVPEVWQNNISPAPIIDIPKTQEQEEWRAGVFQVIHRATQTRLTA